MGEYHTYVSRKRQVMGIACAILMVLAVASCAKTTTTTPPPNTNQAGQNATGLPLVLQPGFSIDIFAQDLDDPRVIAWDPSGTMLVSIPDRGRVVALPDPRNTGKAERTVDVITGLNQPHGLAFRTTGNSTKLYIAETNQVAMYDYDAQAMKATNKVMIADLPAGAGHSTRTIMFRPPPNDDQLLISVGSSCNVCHESDPRRAAILSCNADGSNLQVFASGLRNSVFMALRPGTSDIWATEMGRDYLGDNIPPDEINIIQEGGDYGWPTCYGKNIHDTQFDTNQYFQDPCSGKIPSHIDIQAHSAPLGLDFIPAEGWPAGYAGDLVVALHGSWNRSIPTGDKVVLFRLDDAGNSQAVEDFITGWMKDDGGYLGRPAGVSVRDGAIYITDDLLGYVYRVTYAQ